MRRLTRLIPFWTTVVVLLVPADGGQAERSAGRQEPIVFQASDLLRPDVLSGPNYRIGDRVTVRDNRYLFHIQTRWGTLEAHGLNMLSLRLQEVRAIERAERLARQPQVIDGVLETVAQTPRGVGVLLTDPVAGVLGVPKGVKRFATSKMHPEDRRAGSLTRRRFAYRIGCDPETDNPILKRLLDNLAARKGTALLASKIGLSAAVPGLGLVPLTAQMRETLTVKLPHEINQQIDARLANLGVPRQTRRRFRTSPHFTTLQRLAYLRRLDRLDGVANRAVLVAAAADAESPSDALVRLDELRMLEELHEERGIGRVWHDRVTTARLDDGTRVTVVSADFVVNDGDVTRAITRLRRSGRDAVIHCSGRLSRRTKSALSMRGVRFRELQ